MQCTLRHNLKYGQIMKELSAFSEMHAEHEAADMCIVAILSHGDDGLIFSSGMMLNLGNHLGIWQPWCIHKASVQ